MRRLLIAFLALLATSVSASSGDVVRNGDFERGHPFPEEWCCGGLTWPTERTGPPPPPGAADPRGMIVEIPPEDGGRWIDQQILPVQLGGEFEFAALEFDAWVLGSTGIGGVAVVEAALVWDSFYRESFATARVEFSNGTVGLSAWSSVSDAAPSPSPGSPTAAAPIDERWHRYRVDLVAATRLAILSIDGTPRLAAQGGDLLNDGVPAWIVAGDLAPCDCLRGPAPDLHLDNVKFEWT